MTRPLLSGFCNPGNPATSHQRCRLEGCTCYCHAPQLAEVTPAPTNMPPLPDGLTPAGYTPPIVDVPLVELTADERRRVIAGHLELHPDTILETVRSILEARLSEGTVTP